MRRGLATLLLLLLAPLTGGLESVAADTIRLRSGRELEVTSVRVLADRLNVNVKTDGVPSRVDLPFSRLDPYDLLRVLDANSDPQDGAAWLRSARLAFGAGLPDHAAMRFIQAARVDPTLRSARNEGLAAIRRAEAQGGLDDLEQRLREGRDPRGASLLASAILESAYAAELTPAQRLHVEALGSLARRLIQRDGKRHELKMQKLGEQAKQAAAAKAAPVVPLGEAPTGQPAPAGEPTADELAPLRAQLGKAFHAREAAADPALSVDAALRYLEIAARELLDGRRAARRIRIDALDEEGARELEDIGLELRDLLVGTYLELADLYRQGLRFDEARARVRAVLILDPGNEQAWSQRHLIEDDLREASSPIDDPYRYTIRSPVFFGWASPSPYYGRTWFGFRGGTSLRPVSYRRVPYRRATGRRR